MRNHKDWAYDYWNRPQAQRSLFRFIEQVQADAYKQGAEDERKLHELAKSEQAEPVRSLQ